MKSALDYFQETSRKGVVDIMREHGYGSEEIQQLSKTPWYFLPYICRSKTELAAFRLFKDGWYHPADCTKWFLSLMPVGCVIGDAPSAPDRKDEETHFGLQHLHVALVLVWDTLVQYPKMADQYKKVGSVLDTLTAIFYRRPPFAGYFADALINSVHFRHSICEYILTQRGDYHLGHDTLPPTDDFPEVSDAKKARDILFTKQKNTLFHIARSLQRIRPFEVYDYARHCPDFFFVDELEFYYGGAGRACADIRMTRMALSLEDAKSVAAEYVRANAPPIDYREIFSSLNANCFGQKRLLPADRTVEDLFPEPSVWMGHEKFFALLQAQGFTLGDFKNALFELSCSNQWLRPFVRISNLNSRDFETYNQLSFAPETGCSWLFCDIRS